MNDIELIVRLKYPPLPEDLYWDGLDKDLMNLYPKQAIIKVLKREKAAKEWPDMEKFKIILFEELCAYEVEQNEQRN
jgi:hypothetical protein